LLQLFKKNNILQSNVTERHLLDVAKSLITVLWQIVSQVYQKNRSQFGKDMINNAAVYFFVGTRTCILVSIRPTRANFL